MKSFLASRLPDVMVPQKFEFLQELPLTRNGKIDKKRLIADAADVMDEEASAQSEINTPGSAEEKNSEEAKRIADWMASIWAEQLSFPGSLEYDVNPFDIGANSISAAAVAGRLRDEVAECAEISFETVLRVLLGAPSISDAASGLTRRARSRVGLESGKPRVEIISLHERDGGQDSPPRITAFFSDSLTDGLSMVKIAAAMPEDAGTIVAVAIPDDDWLTSHPADTVTDAIADLVAAELGETNAEEYSLIGYSYGALVAIETARRLLETGRNVLPLGLIDPQIVPVLADDRLSEVMFLTSRGASLDAIAPSEEKAPELVDIFNWVSARVRSGSFPTAQVPGFTPRTTDEDADARSSVERFFTHLASLDEQERWRMYQDAMPAGQHASLGHLRQEWLRYRHTMQAATVTPDPLVADAVIIQPRSSHGFLPGTHEHSARLWRDVFIGVSTVAHVGGTHFTMLDAGHAADTTDALVGGLAALGIFPDTPGGGGHE